MVMTRVQPFAFPIFEMLGIEGYADARNSGIGEPAFDYRALDDIADRGQGISNAAHRLSCRLVAHDERIGLGTVKKPKSHACEGRVKERALAFYHVPVIRFIGGGKPFGSARDEVGHDASIARPRPEIRTPVWPVARKSQFIPRRRISLSIAKAVYFL